jgi:hypothetical protein
MFNGVLVRRTAFVSCAMFVDRKKFVSMFGVIVGGFDGSAGLKDGFLA